MEARGECHMCSSITFHFTLETGSLTESEVHQSSCLRFPWPMIADVCLSAQVFMCMLKS